MNKKMGRPLHIPSEAQRKVVTTLAGFGIPQDKIAAAVEISIMTLTRHYEKELNAGAAQVEANLIGNLMRIAQGRDGAALRACMFALSCRFGWSQYAPAPAPEPGKKELAERNAVDGEVGTSWSDVLEPSKRLQ